eukprot:768109-Hanusia_phi.AAC.2
MSEQTDPCGLVKPRQGTSAVTYDVLEVEVVLREPVPLHLLLHLPSQQEGLQLVVEHVDVHGSLARAMQPRPRRPHQLPPSAMRPDTLAPGYKVKLLVGN